MNAATWAVVLATFVGPIAAVMVSRWDEGRRAIKARRWSLFITLMGMRGRFVEREYVRALNSVHAEFFNSQPIVDALRAFLAHVELQANDIVWQHKYRDLLTALLVEIGHVVGFKGSALEIGRNAYYPTQWAKDQVAQETVQQYLVDLSEGNKVMLVRVVPPVSNGGSSGGADTA